MEYIYVILQLHWKALHEHLFVYKFLVAIDVVLDTAFC